MLIIIIVSDRNIIIIGGAALFIIIFVIFVLGRPNKAVWQRVRTQPPVSQTIPQGQSNEMNVMLSAQINSSESGIATLEETNGRVTVNLYLTGYTADVAQPAHIHVGTCPGVGAISYPLNSVLNGRSTTVLNTSLAQLKQQLPLAINVHKSNTAISTYTSCGSL